MLAPTVKLPVVLAVVNAPVLAVVAPIGVEFILPPVITALAVEKFVVTPVVTTWLVTAWLVISALAVERFVN